MQQEKIIWTLNDGDQHPATDFTATSTFPVNSALNNDVFKFDLKIEQTIHTPQDHWSGEIYINSSDRTFAIAGKSLPIQNITLADQAQTEFTIIRPTSKGFNILICGEHPRCGKVCEVYGENYLPNSTFEHDYIAIASFLASISETPQNTLNHTDTGTRPSTVFTHARGEMNGGIYQNWMYDNNSSSIATSQPFLGIFVGLFKDYRHNVNRVLIHNTIENQSITARLIKITKFNKEKIFDNRHYKLNSLTNDLIRKFSSRQ